MWIVREGDFMKKVILIDALKKLIADEIRSNDSIPDGCSDDYRDGFNSALELVLNLLCRL